MRSLLFPVVSLLFGVFAAPAARAQVDVADTSVYMPNYDPVNNVIAVAQFTTPTSGLSWDNVPSLPATPGFSLPFSGNLPATGEPPYSFVLFDAPGGGPVSAIWYLGSGYNFFYIMTEGNSSAFMTLVNHAIASTPLYTTVQATGALQDVTQAFNGLWNGQIDPLPGGTLEADIAFAAATPVPEPATWLAGALMVSLMAWQGLGSVRRRQPAA